MAPGAPRLSLLCAHGFMPLRPVIAPLSTPSSALWPCLMTLAALLQWTGVQAQPVQDTLAPVVVTGTRTEQRAFDLPMSIDVISRDSIQNGKARVNISEDLNRVPGTFVQNRENFAQELQITIRGFGARSQFGTRGVKLIADGLPASTPDGQGNPGGFDLNSAERIEVLRGPFSALYGNHSGGVVQVFSESGGTPPAVAPDLQFGSYGFQRYALKGGGATDSFNGMASASYFSVDGYRQHSAARKAQFNTKLGYSLNDSNQLTLVANGFNQPNSQDPLGLTQQQVQQDPRQAQPVAIAFDARRSLENLQGGLIWDSKLSAQDSLRVLGYVGSRSNEQFLAVPLANQQAATSSGGVSELDRQLAGAAVRWTRQQELLGGPLTLTAGAEYDASTEARQGYINNFGVRGALKRDEDNSVDSFGAYAQAEWRFVRDWSVSAGLRYTKVDFKSEDHYIATGNPDDSGSTAYGEWTPTAALLFSVSPTINVYASYGRAFETPTTIELAYRPDGLSGLNFALQPSTSDQYEVGAKALLGEATRLNVAVFSIRTGGEIVIARNTGGRSSFQNASDSSRLGAELLLESDLGAGLSTHVALTFLNARFDAPFRSCAPLAAFCNPVTGQNTAIVPDGSRIPGVPNASLFADLAYRNPGLGLHGALELVANGPVAVNDFNSEFAAGYAIANLWVGLEQLAGRWRFREFARVSNLFGKEYIGAVIVGDANGRYYAPAPTRNALIGVTATYSF
jgi:iron complex outermembrane recepter protein